MARGLFVLRSEILVPQVIVRLAYETHQSVSTPDRCDETSYLHSILSTVTIDRRVVKKGPKQRFASEVNPIENYTTPSNQPLVTRVICLKLAYFRKAGAFNIDPVFVGGTWAASTGRVFRNASFTSSSFIHRFMGGDASIAIARNRINPR